MTGSNKVDIALVLDDTPIDRAGPLGNIAYLIFDPVVPVAAFSSDGTVGWLAANLYHGATCPDGCPDLLREEKRNAERAPPYHLTALVDGDHVIFVHFASTGEVSGHGSSFDEAVDDQAKSVAALFKKTIADPKALAATVSARKDAMMYGSEARERFVGGDAMRAALVKWALAFEVTGGIRAGVTKNKTIAWVVADVDTVAKAGKKPVPYRVSAIYEKTSAEWKLVQLHFS